MALSHGRLMLIENLKPFDNFYKIQTLFLRVRNNARHNLNYLAANYCSVQEAEVKPRKKSRAMEAFLEQAQKYETFLQQQTTEYNKGKKFLAKIMGEDHEKFTPDKIDSAIEYLFPSGLFEPKARPMFKHPTKLFPKPKEAAFDNTGRPFHFLFYTAKPNFCNVLHECGNYIEDLQRKCKSGSSVPAVEMKNLVGTEWMKKEELEAMCSEVLLDIEYEKFIEAMEWLVKTPNSHLYEAFIMKYRNKILINNVSLKANVKVTKCENGVEMSCIEK